jgi:hypothetical protein
VALTDDKHWITQTVPTATGRAMPTGRPRAGGARV